MFGFVIKEIQQSLYTCYKSLKEGNLFSSLSCFLHLRVLFLQSWSPRNQRKMCCIEVNVQKHLTRLMGLCGGFLRERVRWLPIRWASSVFSRDHFYPIKLWFRDDLDKTDQWKVPSRVRARSLAWGFETIKRGLVK